MSKSVQKYTIMLHGAPYTIVSDESFESVQELASRVQEQMDCIAQAIGTNDAQKIATYTALMYASSVQDQEKKIKALLDLCTSDSE